LQGEDSFLDSLEAPWKERCWRTLADRSTDIAAFVAPSRYFGELMSRRMQLEEVKVHVLPNGISLEGFGEPALSPQVPTIGYLARLYEGKGLGLVVDAFIRLKNRGGHPDLRLLCVGTTTAGDDAYIDQQKRKLSRAGLSASTEFRPNVTRDEKIAALKEMTLLSVPAKYGEAFGLYLLEAWAAGIPVVQPRHGAFPELVDGVGGGVLFEPGNADALADAWDSLLNNPELIRELGQRGRTAVTTRYSLEQSAREFLALTEEQSARTKPVETATGA
jgi:glycosyltransferase involved in cell wall biosynthesis